MKPSNDITVELHAVPSKVTADGKSVDFSSDGNISIFTLKGKRHDEGDIRFEVKY